MRGDELRNWLAVLGIGGGLAIAAPDAGAADGPGASAGVAGEPPFARQVREPLYVVINHEEQYSIWPAPEKAPEKWRVLHDEIDLAGAVRRFPRIGDQRFRVVINHEEQYSVWPEDRRLPRGFKPVAELEDREPCRIDECGRLLAELTEGGGGS